MTCSSGDLFSVLWQDHVMELSNQKGVFEKNGKRSLSLDECCIEGVLSWRVQKYALSPVMVPLSTPFHSLSIVPPIGRSDGHLRG